MGTMSVRATYALDAETAEIIRQLASTWGVSQAEVIRRSVRIAVTAKGASAPTPADVISHYRDHPAPRNWEETERLVAEMGADAD